MSSLADLKKKAEGLKWDYSHLDALQMEGHDILPSNVKKARLAWEDAEREYTKKSQEIEN